jgi:hypothetical protein
MSKRCSLSNLALMLAALVIVSAGCANRKQSPDDEAQSAFDDVRAEIQSAVVDPERALKAQALISELQQEFIDVGQTIRSRRAKFIALYANYDSTRADIDASLDEIRSAASSNQEEIGSVHRQLVDLLTAEEWDAVEEEHSEALSAAIQESNPRLQLAKLMTY